MEVELDLNEVDGKEKTVESLDEEEIAGKLNALDMYKAI